MGQSEIIERAPDVFNEKFDKPSNLDYGEDSLFSALGGRMLISTHNVLLTGCWAKTKTLFSACFSSKAGKYASAEVVLSRV